jgi:LacI family transcriptional regulator
LANIRDVARRAGVAPITASRVLNNSGYASHDTRARVEAAAAELGYVTNRLASSLRLKRTHTLALVLTDITNPFWTTVARGVMDAAAGENYSVLVCNTDENEQKEDQHVRMLLERQVDGFLLVPASHTSHTAVFIHAQGTPAVVLDRHLPGAPADTVRCDSEGGAFQLVQLLLQRGYRRIVALTGPRHISTAEDRARGYQRAMREAGLQEDIRLHYGHFTQVSGYEMTLQALEDRPDAIFAANNFIAIGAARALQETGRRIPQDIALAGFDDLPSLLVNPFLTVAAQPAYQMGQQAAGLLLARLSGAAPQDFQEIVLPCEVIERASTAGSSSPVGQDGTGTN